MLSEITKFAWLVLLTCCISGNAATAQETTSDAAKEAASIYAARCAGCHGPSGKGDGTIAAALTPKPRDLTTAEWQKSVTDEYIEKIIRGGGAVVGKSMLMPGNPDLESKPDVVAELRAIVRGMRSE